MNRPLGILVATGVGGPTGHSNLIRVRLTDPTDPFFLYQLELVEDDYGRFKKDHQLHVDFHEFASDFAGMLHDVVIQQSAVGSGSDVRTGTESRLLFAVGNQAGATAQLFVQELTRVKTTNILELQLNREGDVGQKHYLAEQFEHFQQSYYEAETQRKDQAIAMERTIGELRGALSALEKDRDNAEGQLKVGASQSESRLQRALLERQDEYSAELKALRVAADEERTALNAKIESLTQQHRAFASAKDADLAQYQSRVNALELSEASLKGQLNMKAIALDAQLQETQHLAAQVQQLSEHRSTSQRLVNDNGLQIVQLTERLSASERQSNERVEETRVLRKQALNDAETIRVLTDQVKERNVKLQEAEGDLKKAHHIIGNQLQASKQQKEKFASIVQQLSDTRFMLDQQQLKNTEAENALDASRVEQRRLNHDISQLKEQLQSMLDTNTTLEQDLKLARDAVVHVQRHGAYSFGRNLNSISGTPGMAPSSDLYRQYASNSSQQAVPQTKPAAAPTAVSAVTGSVASNNYFQHFPTAGTSATGHSTPYTTSMQFYQHGQSGKLPPTHATADAPTAYF